MSRKPTQKQRSFALAYLETGNASEAYRRSYSVRNMSAKTVNEEACKLLNHPNVTPIIEQGRAEARERSQVTIESLTDELEENRRGALKAVPCQAAAAVAATMAKAKLHGLVG